MAPLFRFGFKPRQRKCFPIPITSSSDREAAVYAAKLAEKAGRYDEMVESMKKVAEMDVDLTIEERNLLSVAYNKVINSRRASRRMLCSIKHDEELKGNEQYANWIKEYRDKVESELTNICNEIVTVIDKHLIPSCTNAVSTVLYYKLKGDYYRYLAEFKAGNDGNDVADKSLKAYELATNLAETVLPPTHPLRLGLALNFSVFYYEILNSTERACHLANQAFDEIVSDEAYMDIILVLQLLRDNLALWTSEIPDDADEAQKRLRLEAKLQVANKVRSPPNLRPSPNTLQ